MNLMRNLLRAEIISLCFCFLTQPALAGEMLFQLSPLYQSTAQNESGTDQTTTTTGADITLGYFLNRNIALGLRYDMSSATTTTGNSTSKVEETDYGPAIGYFHERGFFALFSYLLSYTYKDDSYTYTGDGMKLDVGYIYKVGSYGLGGELTYYSLIRKKRQASGGTTQDLDPTWKYSGYMLPKLVFQWVF